ncbi:alpha-galactosidase [Paenibacillus allorhizosphaerae]|uniref:alpha-galactosidase n=1 Tax=Paenibacillus allorhizosphaerae TaxID=2849866 RepID=UPI001C403568|nr:alpha-galactosidase [Paenibacillus allorhizosphaerae]
MERYKDCYYSIAESRLTIGNDGIERSWELAGGILYTKSILHKRSSDEWIRPDANLPMFRLPIELSGEQPQVEVTSRLDDDAGIGKEHMIVSLVLTYVSHKIRMDTRIYPGTAIMRHTIGVKTVRVNVHAADQGNDTGMNGDRIEEQYRKTVHDGNQAAPVQLDANSKPKNAPPGDHIDALAIDEMHCSWVAVALRDRTDTNNNVVSEDSGLLYPNERKWLEGNLLRLKKTMSDSGLLWLKESPTRFGQLHYGEGDYRMMGKQLYMAGTGLRPEELRSDEYVYTYGSVVGLFQGGDYDAFSLLHQYHQCLREWKSDRDCFIMSNTWGDRSRDGRVGEAFVRSELPVAAALGITHYQIDDGWQQGITSNSVEPGGTWGDYYSRDGNFWSVHPQRFPNGLEPVVAMADEYGIQLGLWFSPDSSQDGAHWERDADQLLDLYRRYGICYFKLDGIEIRSKRGERNLLNMMRKVVRETSGAVYFNQDTTSGMRLGYYGQTQYGGLFLENRYTDWTNYYPHWTLRNFWMLSKYVPAQKLQIEFLNVERNTERYKDDPLAPSRCGIAYAFAVTMFANPLAWMEVTGLNEANRQLLSAHIRAYRNVQAHLHSGHIVPIGEEPSGTSWTGFQSIVNDKEGYVLVLREWNGREEGRFKLRNVSATRLEMQCIISSQHMEASFAAEGEVLEHEKDRIMSIDGSHGDIACKLNQPFAFALYHYSIADA